MIGNTEPIPQKAISVEVEILNRINTFRDDPSTIIEDCKLLKSKVEEENKDDPIIGIMSSYISLIEDLTSLKRLALNAELSQVASKELKKLAGRRKGLIQTKKQRECKGIVPSAYLEEYPLIIYYSSSGKINNLLPKLLISKRDNTAFRILTIKEHSQIGIACEENNNMTNVVLIFAKALPSVKEEEVPESDLNDLKEVFDLFDYQKEGKIRISDTLRSMKEYKFDQSEPALFNIIQQIGTKKDIIGWPEFGYSIYYKLSDRSSTEGLKDIFEIIKDDVTKGNIDLDSLDKLCTRVGIKKSKSELNDILMYATNNQNEITFDMFCELMEN